MGKDQRNKKHGLDKKQMKRMKREQDKAFAPPPPIQPKRRGRGQR